jgi:hypothetical protein
VAMIARRSEHRPITRTFAPAVTAPIRGVYAGIRSDMKGMWHFWRRSGRTALRAYPGRERATGTVQGQAGRSRRGFRMVDAMWDSRRGRIRAVSWAVSRGAIPTGIGPKPAEPHRSPGDGCPVTPARAGGVPSASGSASRSASRVRRPPLPRWPQSGSRRGRSRGGSVESAADGDPPAGRPRR